jgi:DNA-binding PadR family transcriptional regulator
MSKTNELEIVKPTLEYLLQNGLIVKTHNGAGVQMYALTEKGEEYFSPKVESRTMAFWESGA